MRKLYKLGAVILMALLLCFGQPAAAAERENYEPVDVVLVIDISGSMKTSDADRNVLKAARMFVNMMPAQDSRIAVVGFNDSAVTYTTKDGEAAYYELDDLQNIGNVHDILDTVEYTRDTGIGFGLSEAVSLMSSNDRDGCQKAIVLFSDGVDDLKSQVDYQDSQDKLAEAVVWAGQNNCPIYSVGFNYQMEDGTGSLGEAGVEKLQYISEHTGAFLKEVNTLDEIEENFMQILAEICRLKYHEVDEIPGDGEYHEVPVDVTTGVIEMNIRIACDTADALRSGTIQLKDPSGNEFLLEKNEKCFYDLEERSASLKIVKPATGEWTLVLDGIEGENIKIGLLNHYSISLNAYPVVPEGNDENTVYVGDTVGIVCEITDENGQNADEAMYQELNFASALVDSRADEEEDIVVPLEYKDGVLKGSYTATGKAICDVTVTVDSEYFAKTAAFVVENGNRPFEVTGTLENQEIKVKKSGSIDDIYNIVSDAEGDEITASIVHIENEKVASARVENDNIVLEGLKWGSAIVTVEYQDAQGNKETLDFSVKVKDPVKVFLLSMIPVILAIAVLIVVFLSLQKTRTIRGNFRIGPVVMGKDGKNAIIGTPISMDAKILFRGNKNMKGVMRKYATKIKTQPFVTADQADMLTGMFINAGNQNQMAKVLEKLTFKGTFFGKKGFILIIPAGYPVELNSHLLDKATKYKVERTQELVLKVQTRDGASMRVTLNYEKKR